MQIICFRDQEYQMTQKSFIEPSGWDTYRIVRFVRLDMPGGIGPSRPVATISLIKLIIKSSQCTLAKQGT